ncbi:potassium-transporting ATPase subunit KdpA [Mycobacteroides chelonae]|uniref:Potassium-transporting ATPase potassium-binding subunit n=1 Tax=Mycobacteroides chelonae TaxID=1774 RepID=A0AB73LPL3_MYCCH|nr:potassium-transporting ATPase subunit KdpA [Mycobacteroides chelonae]MBF9326288.1 potassium-transporting ATPase subunit KdpA [Mycobacteroides chelonae]MBF9420463.1 potassium-transporting ATPase subunit KdpA [Mycobacteroides chelonae]MBF9438876.1 potassium-transporting ATPase subunit KdpA [Mycobacteroides chelonae]MBV0919292.1 potassium-transporting ATPase subunit KdpA [Mycobacteroides chelonae]MBV6360242.1 potassium-transporting ATPase subunit KdpA [Mycobacteroides chelonae]
MNSALAAGLQIGFVILVLAIAYVPLGDYMARVFTGPHSLRASGPSTVKHSLVERVIYRAGRVDPETEQTWVGYTLSLLGFSFASVLFLYLLQRIQGVLPLSGDLGAVSPAVAFNTAVSFVTNTNWQSYTPETTMTNLTQMVGLAVQNFVSAAVGLAVAVALIRGIVRTTTGGELGNFWVDLVRGSLRILLPLSFVVALILLSQGTIQSLYTHFDATALDGTAQHIALAPVASQEAIKEVGTNGGGILAANSAHPFENPTPLTNIVEILAILIVPVCLTRSYSTMVGDKRQGLTVLSVMATLFGGMLAFVTWAESTPRGIAAQAAGAMMEGKEVRFGIPATSLFAVATTGTSTGAVDAAHDSFTAAGGGALILNMLFGEIAPGGVGTGLYGILVLAIIAVFVGGLLVGRTPEFLGKKIGRREITMAALSVLVMPALVLIGTGISVALSTTPGYQGNSGDPGSAQSIHGFSEVLYAYASAANNNGSAFGGLTVTSHWFQASLGVAMLLGRFLPIIFTLALAGSLATQQKTPVSAGTLHTHGPMFAGLHTGTVLLVAALTFFPALALGPIAEAVL